MNDCPVACVGDRGSPGVHIAHECSEGFSRVVGEPQESAPETWLVAVLQLRAQTFAMGVRNR
jgi:hypothetical protein